MKKLLLLLFAFTFVLQSCSDDNDEDKILKTNTIVDVAVNAELTSLVAAVTRAGLVDVLSAPEAKTVLAPTNTAFAEFLEANEFDSIDDVPVDVLKNILLNHVIDGKLASTDLSTATQTLWQQAMHQIQICLYLLIQKMA